MSNGDSKTKQWADWGFRILSVLIVPLVGYVFTIQADMADLNGQIAVQDEKIGTLQSDVAELNVKVKDIEANKLVLVRLETELKNANKTLSRIETAISSLGDD